MLSENRTTRAGRSWIEYEEGERGARGRRPSQATSVCLMETSLEPGTPIKNEGNPAKIFRSTFAHQSCRNGAKRLDQSSSLSILLTVALCHFRKMNTLTNTNCVRDFTSSQPSQNQPQRENTHQEFKHDSKNNKSAALSVKTLVLSSLR